jgi:hypothetical protein
LVPDVYPAYISWEQYEQNQETIAENRQKMEQRLMRKQAIRQGAALLTGLVRCGLCGHAMQVAYKDQRFQYLCQNARSKYARPSCQYLGGQRIDAAVVQEFFRVLQPAQIDALEQLSSHQAPQHRELLHHLQQEVERLDYAAKRAERQYNQVEPENRLIAAALEKKWESALAELTQARAQLDQTRAKSPQAVKISRELRDAFADVGQRLPEIWPSLAVQARKELLRTLVRGVNLQRDANGMVTIRIVWRGELVSQTQVRLAVSTRRRSEIEARIVSRIRELANQGIRDLGIAEYLNREGYYPCRGDTFTPGIVLKLRCRHGICLGRGRRRRGELPHGYTIRMMARRIGVDPSWIYRGISKGTIRVARDEQFGCYLFPRGRATIKEMKRLKKGEIRYVSFPKEHSNG